jgi:alpha-beta hydrolase superfamily lysophospholipase
VRLEFRTYVPSATKASVIVVHGFAEHGNRYGHLIDALLPAGFAAMTFDLRGHGRSGGRRVFVERFGEYTDDLVQAVAVAKRELPAPLFMFAHSMGGLIALRTLQDAPGLVPALAVSNPSLGARVAVPAWKVVLAKAASRIAPSLTVPTGLPPDGISRDPAAVKAYADDPQVSKVATARWYTEFLQAQTEVLARPEALRGLPLLALIGDGDTIIDPLTNRDFFARVGGDACEVRTYPGFYHELCNEPAGERDKVLGELATWLSARQARATA